MKTLTSTLTMSRAGEARPRLSDYLELTKPRLSLMSVATAILGYFAAGPELNVALFAALVVGTTLGAFGAAALNQWWEREADAKMVRTADRPVANGRMTPWIALVFGLVLSIGSVLILWLGVNAAASLLTAATILLYVLAYTPLKMHTPWATEIGAIPGALPPLVGWVAAGAGFSSMGWVLFAILFAWQIPHFMAISWNCREDYRNAGFRMLAIDDPSGRAVAVRALVWTVLLIVISFYPLLQPEIGWPLAVVAAILGYTLLAPAVRFLVSDDKDAAARKLFFATLAYLPLYLGALVVDRFFL